MPAPPVLTGVFRIVGVYVGEKIGYKLYFTTERMRSYAHTIQTSFCYCNGFSWYRRSARCSGI
ncbi:XapX domain-containing protein [Paraliobacillus sp. JSM ZJ581]|uniref:XapX domain-containing protein n=1 Tax=Paraliobacillus sp. JSM ZJ581 TaxID=3342118 RepID=UPI0035A9472C